MNCSCDPSTATLCPEGERLKEEWGKAFRRSALAGHQGAPHLQEVTAWQAYGEHLIYRTPGTRQPPPSASPGERVAQKMDKLPPPELYIIRRFLSGGEESWQVARLEQTGKTKRFVYLTARPE